VPIGAGGLERDLLDLLGVWRAVLAGDGAVAGGQARPPVLVEQHDGTAVQLEQGADGAGDPLQGGAQVAVDQQAGGQLVEDPGLALAPLGLRLPALPRAHQRAHHQGDQQVHRERQVVLAVVHLEVAVWRQEQQVEGEEAERGGGEARPEAAVGGGGDHHHQVRQHHVGGRHLVPEPQQQGGDGGGAGEGDRIAHQHPRALDAERSVGRALHGLQHRSSRLLMRSLHDRGVS
jgi:hypothetical protein